MTTILITEPSGLITRGNREVATQYHAPSLGESSSLHQFPIAADGLLLLAATLISRLFCRLFGATVYTTESAELPDYYFPPSCCDI